MIYETLHKPSLRLLAAILGELISAAAINLFIVPLNLYAGGLMGVCQLLRTLLQTYAHLNFGTVDIAGLIYFLSNVPILLIAYKNLGRPFVIKTILCTVAYSLFYSVIPTPQTPIVSDYLTACLLGGILLGVGSGIVLTCGASGGGLDVLGLCLSKRGSPITVGKFSLSFNAVLYTACLFLFSPEVAIYSVIFNFATALVLDRMHQQNINNQALIFTHQQDNTLDCYIMEKMGRGVSYWKGVGAYTGDDLRILCVCLSKFEVEELIRTVHTVDPHAFVTIQERVRVIGNFTRKLD